MFAVPKGLARRLRFSASGVTKASVPKAKRRPEGRREAAMPLLHACRGHPTAALLGRQGRKGIEQSFLQLSSSPARNGDNLRAGLGQRPPVPISILLFNGQTSVGQEQGQ